MRRLSRSGKGRLGAQSAARRLFVLLAVPVLAATLGCGSTLSTQSSVARARAALKAKGIEDPIVAFEPTEEMKEWVAETIPAGLDKPERIEALARALVGKSGLGIDYTRDLTVTAPEVFKSHQANCLSFTQLFVGLAREIGVPVYFLEVRDLENYTREGDLIVHSDHIAVGYGPAHQMTVIDFAVEQGTKYRKIRPISDLAAIALFYSNRGADFLRHGDPDTARDWLTKAVTIEPDLSSGWINYGVALRRSGFNDQAESAYRRALELDPTQYSAYQNLATLLRLAGEEREALDLLSLANQSQNRNPYLYVSLGDLSLRYGRVGEAERYYRRAVRLSDEAEPLAALGLLHAQEGELPQARRLLRRARKANPDDARVVLLQRRLEAKLGGRDHS